MWSCTSVMCDVELEHPNRKIAWYTVPSTTRGAKWAEFDDHLLSKKNDLVITWHVILINTSNLPTKLTWWLFIISLLRCSFFLRTRVELRLLLGQWLPPIPMHRVDGGGNTVSRWNSKRRRLRALAVLIARRPLLDTVSWWCLGSVGECCGRRRLQLLTLCTVACSRFRVHIFGWDDDLVRAWNRSCRHWWWDPGHCEGKGGVEGTPDGWRGVGCTFRPKTQRRSGAVRCDLHSWFQGTVDWDWLVLWLVEWCWKIGTSSSDGATAIAHGITVTE